MKVLLTGAYGNVGSHTLPALVAAGHAVRTFDLPARGRRAPPGVDARWGDLRDPAAVAAAAAGVDAVLHLGAVIPPASDEDVAYARAVNVDGTANVLAACLAQPTPPRLIFTSTFDLFGRTQHLPPPRRVTDPIETNDPYTEHKARCEELIRASGLQWFIVRCADMPVIGLRAPHPIMFEIGLHNRIEALHPGDAALALTNALSHPDVWGRTLLLGGGPSCQLTYGQYLERVATATGITLPGPEAFSARDYVTDWLDTEESEALLRYQRRSFDEIVAEIAACLGWRRWFVPLARPFVRWRLRAMSPYWRG